MSSVHSLGLLLKAVGPMCYICVGISEQTITRVGQEASCGSAAFSSPAKGYKVSRWRVLVDTFDCEAIKRGLYQLYEVKEHMTVKKPLVKRLCVTVVKP